MVSSASIYGTDTRALTNLKASSRRPRTYAKPSPTTARFASPLDALQARLAEIAARRAQLSVTETVATEPVPTPAHGDRSCTKGGWEKTVSRTIDSPPFADRSENRPELIELKKGFTGKNARDRRTTALVARTLWDNLHPAEPVLAAYGISDAQAEYNLEHLWDDKTPMERFESLRIPSERQHIFGPGF